jgi:hypothetical protein
MASVFLALVGSLAGFLPGLHTSVRLVPAQLTGSLVVSFHGDQASECAAKGVCDYSGTLIFRPGSSAFLSSETLRLGAKVQTAATLALPLAVTGSQVSRSTASGQAARCADEQQPTAISLLQPKQGIVTLSLIQSDGSLLATRCAGPLDADVAAAAPHASLPLSLLMKGRTSFDLTGSTTFAGGGFAGTVNSTVRVTLGAPRSPLGRSLLPRHIKYKRIRFVSEQLSAGLLSSTVHGNVIGVADPEVCSLVDSCGATGTITPIGGPQHVKAQLLAIGAATVPYRRFVDALHGQRVHGVAIEGQVQWTGGLLGATLTMPGVSCTDSATIDGGSLNLVIGHAAIFTSYAPAGSLRTHCPGPYIDEQARLAAGRAPRAVLGHRSFSLTLRGTGPLSDDGYVVNWGGTIRITLRRGRITQHTLRLPNG